MKKIEIIANFEREINKIDDVVNKPATEDSLFWLNQAVAKFIKLRFNGDFVHNTGYEETEKRREDLISLFKSHSWESKDFVVKDDHANYVEYNVVYPSDFLYALDEEVIIDSINGGHILDTCVFECTRDSFMYRINNSLTDFHYKYHRARPLRIRHDGGCALLTDGNYTIQKYTLGYLRQPTELTLKSVEDAKSEYTDFNDHIMYEIIKMAAQMYIENQADPRYRTISDQVLTQE